MDAEVGSGFSGDTHFYDNISNGINSISVRSDSNISNNSINKKADISEASTDSRQVNTQQPTSPIQRTAYMLAKANAEKPSNPSVKSMNRILDIKDTSLDWGSTQVIIDIDDTVKSSGGYKLFNVPLGGVDTQYSRGELYPGSFQFILELAMYKMGKNRKPLLLAVLTTRIPQVPITVDSALNLRLRDVAEKRGVLNWGIDCTNKILYSTLKEWVFNESRGEKKFVNFRKLHKFVCSENCNARYIWIGDTGDKDLEAGEMMIKYFPGKIRAVFMHCVTPSNVNDPNGIPNDYYLKSVPVLFFRTYVGAAKKALEHGLLNHNALSRVIVRAILDLNEDGTSDPSKWRDLLKDVLEVEEIANLKRYESGLVIKTRAIIESRIKELSQSLY